MKNFNQISVKEPSTKEELIEIFTNLKYNLEVIYTELVQMDYKFKTKPKFNSDIPLANPLPNVEDLLIELDELIKPYGFAPESLKYFYRIVGSCNFIWDTENFEDLLWDYADPIEILSLDDLVSYVKNDDFRDAMEYEDQPYLELSADYYHKDNTSGGRAYGIAIVTTPAIDAPFLHEEHETTFINYLRISMENCGFSRIKKGKNNYQIFFDRVKPQLKQI